MSQPDLDLIKDFQDESMALIRELVEILDECEDNPNQTNLLEKYGQTVDRIMGGAQSLAIGLDSAPTLVNQIGDYSAVCKAVGYKASQIKNNEAFYNICVGLLQDATEALQDMIEQVQNTQNKSAKSFLNQAFIDRLKWVSEKFGSNVRASVDVKSSQPAKMNQAEIDELLKKLGLD